MCKEIQLHPILANFTIPPSGGNATFRPHHRTGCHRHHQFPFCTFKDFSPMSYRNKRINWLRCLANSLFPSSKSHPAHRRIRVEHLESRHLLATILDVEDFTIRVPYSNEP